MLVTNLPLLLLLFDFWKSPGRENYNMKRLVILVVSITGFRSQLGFLGGNDTIFSCQSVF